MKLFFDTLFLLHYANNNQDNWLEKKKEEEEEEGTTRKSRVFLLHFLSVILVRHRESHGIWS